MIINRVWSMPSRWTFTIKPIAELLARYVGDGNGWVDPFAGENSLAEFTNDIEGRGAKSQMDALDFLGSLDNADGVLFDPPYSVEQCLRLYTPKFNGTAGRAEYWGKCKDEIARIIITGGVAISFCWDSCGIGTGRGFELLEILLVCHGACHNDTIVTVERKIQSSFSPKGGVEGMKKEYATHKAWWLDNTDLGRLYKRLHALQHGEKCHERAFWINGACPKCNHNAPDIYKPDLLEAPYNYICQRRNNPVGFAHNPCLYEGNVVLDDFGIQQVTKLMNLRITKLRAIKEIYEIDKELSPIRPVFSEDSMMYHFGKTSSSV